MIQVNYFSTEWRIWCSCSSPAESTRLIDWGLIGKPWEWPLPCSGQSHAAVDDDYLNTAIAPLAVSFATLCSFGLPKQLCLPRQVSLQSSCMSSLTHYSKRHLLPVEATSSTPWLQANCCCAGPCYLELYHHEACVVHMSSKDGQHFGSVRRHAVQERLCLK